MHLMIFYPGGVDRGVPNDMTDNQELYDMLYTTATVEQGNGNGKIKRREHNNGKPEGSERFNR